MKVITPEIYWHAREPIYSVDIKCYKNSIRIVTAGADKLIRLWKCFDISSNDLKIIFIATLSHHSKTVNCVRFSPISNSFVSASDDGIIALWSQKTRGSSPAPDLFGESSDADNKENWVVEKSLRGHLEDVYDLCWSNDGRFLVSGSLDTTAILWDMAKGKRLDILRESKDFVQGVAWDPYGEFVITSSTDKVMRVYTVRGGSGSLKHSVSRLPPPRDNPDQQLAIGAKMFHDDTGQFFRRAQFSPEGSLLFVPCGQYSDTGCKASLVNVTFVFARNNLTRPIALLPGAKRPTLVAKCCPILFENRTESPKFRLPYRIVVAVASETEIVLYDTEQTMPIGYLTDLHYAPLTDLAWSSDGRTLAVSSVDGYVSIISFDANELGVNYHLTAEDVMTELHKKHPKQSPKISKTHKQKNSKAVVNPEPISLPKEANKENLKPFIELKPTSQLNVSHPPTFKRRITPTLVSDPPPVNSLETLTLSEEPTSETSDGIGKTFETANSDISINECDQAVKRSATSDHVSDLNQPEVAKKPRRIVTMLVTSSAAQFVDGTDAKMSDAVMRVGPDVAPGEGSNHGYFGASSATSAKPVRRLTPTLVDEDSLHANEATWYAVTQDVE